MDGASEQPISETVSDNQGQGEGEPAGVSAEGGRQILAAMLPKTVTTNPTQGVISETGSENQKRKRGRPAKYSEDGYAMIQVVFPEVKTRRGLQNKVYELRAIRVLQGKGCDRIAPPVELVRSGKKKFWSFRLLNELGRIEDDNHLIEVAQLICSVPVITKEEAIYTARYYRRVAEGKEVD